MGTSRKLRKTLQQLDQRMSRSNNSARKIKERTRKNTRLVKALKSGKLPYTPTVMSWLSQAIDKPSSQIVQADVEKFVASSK
jgi:cystathionine beta-lyase/cystathionine gamma-synthase